MAVTASVRPFKLLLQIWQRLGSLRETKAYQHRRHPRLRHRLNYNNRTTVNSQTSLLHGNGGHIIYSFQQSWNLYPGSANTEGLVPFQKKEWEWKSLSTRMAGKSWGLNQIHLPPRKMQYFSWGLSWQFWQVYNRDNIVWNSEIIFLTSFVIGLPRRSRHHRCLQ